MKPELSRSSLIRFKKHVRFAGVLKIYMYQYNMYFISLKTLNECIIEYEIYNSFFYCFIL